MPTADKKEAEALQSRTQNPQAFFVSCSPGETRVVEKKIFFFLHWLLTVTIAEILRLAVLILVTVNNQLKKSVPMRTWNGRKRLWL